MKRYFKPVNIVVSMIMSFVFFVKAEDTLSGFNAPPLIHAPDAEQSGMILKLWPVTKPNTKSRVEYDLTPHFKKISWQKLGDWNVEVHNEDPAVGHIEIMSKIIDPIHLDEKATVDVYVCQSNYDALINLWFYRQSNGLPEMARGKIGKIIGDASISYGTLDDSSSGLGFVRGNIFVEIRPIIRDPNRELLHKEMPKREIKDRSEYTKEELEQEAKDEAEYTYKYKKMAHPERDADEKGAAKLVADLAKLIDDKIQKAIEEEQRKKHKK